MTQKHSALKYIHTIVGMSTNIDKFNRTIFHSNITDIETFIFSSFSVDSVTKQHKKLTMSFVI